MGIIQSKNVVLLGMLLKSELFTNYDIRFFPIFITKMKLFTPLILFALFLFFSCGEPTAAIDESLEDTEEISSDVMEEKDEGKTEIKVSADFLRGKFAPEQHEDFVEISTKYASREGMYLQREVYEAFKQMYEVAKKEGISLEIRSATRNFDAQKRIWENKWLGKRPSAGVNAMETYPDPVDRANNILLYSSMPGTSRHHWGTDIDLNSFDNSWFAEGEGLKLYNWMLENASNFGFCQPYTELGEDRPTGYQEEKWHWSYLPLAVSYTQAAKKLLRNEDISGFMGAETAIEIGIVENYVLGINPVCK
ncbi:MAG: D-alanyl-D-alanine carboxypeptidase family protein [Saprospirales bacterium]|nr:MAG: D-alanyl-D-alanine carboxypeptidase family protein [Saprospirales bacterium]